jgi:hypothetical protein
MILGIATLLAGCVGVVIYRRQDWDRLAEVRPRLGFPRQSPQSMRALALVIITLCFVNGVWLLAYALTN